MAGPVPHLKLPDFFGRLWLMGIFKIYIQSIRLEEVASDRVWIRGDGLNFKSAAGNRRPLDWGTTGNQSIVLQYGTLPRVTTLIPRVSRIDTHEKRRHSACRPRPPPSPPNFLLVPVFFSRIRPSFFFPFFLLFHQIKGRSERPTSRIIIMPVREISQKHP